MPTRTIIAMLLACALLACSLFTRPDEPVEQTVAPPAPPPSTGSPPTAASAANPYFGEQSMEERIANADTIVKARLSTTTSEVVRGTGEGWSDYYYVALKFHLTVSEYLKGSGASSITAFTIQGGYYDTQQEAEDAAPGVAANRVTTWDDREAIIFLTEDDFDGAFSPEVRGDNDYFLTIGGGTYHDWYSLKDVNSKLWLPSAETSATGDDQEFLLAVPEPGKDTPTITIRELKSRIAAINAELNAGDGSDAYRNCVSNKYRIERTYQHAQSEGRKLRARAALTHRLVSGSSAGTVIFESDVLGIYPDRKMQTSLEGGDADLFETVDGPTTPWDSSRDGALTDGIDHIRYTQSLRAVRPTPAGDYRFNVKDLEPNLVPCNAFLITEWTVTANAPDGVLHEAFFDPVTVGNAVSADSTNGVLKPTMFTGANGATTTIERIAWEADVGESGTVKMTLSPQSGIANHFVDFIALDGSVSLSLSISAAKVDAANHTLSWPVTSQPWQSGEKLMLRIREEQCSRGAVTDPSANPGLLEDCEALLASGETLAGTATLNWAASSTISTWEGVTLNASSTRVGELELDNEGLDGSIPAALGRLSALVTLDLSDNELIGAIPSELGWLFNLEELRLSGNSLTGCIPLALKSVAVNDLALLSLLYCQPPAPQNLSGGTPTETSIPLSWDAVADAGTYRVEHRSATSTDWMVDLETGKRLGELL